LRRIKQLVGAVTVLVQRVLVVVLLILVYFLGIAPTALLVKVMGRDPMDRPKSGSSSWQAIQEYSSEKVDLLRQS